MSGEWVRVPKIPTEAMRIAGEEALSPGDYSDPPSENVYAAMIAAAPSEPASGEAEPAGWNIRRRNGGLLITGPGGMTTFVDGSLEAGGITGAVLHALAKDLLTRNPQ